MTELLRVGVVEPIGGADIPSVRRWQRVLLLVI
jgi:hypothetical protein